MVQLYLWFEVVDSFGPVDGLIYECFHIGMGDIRALPLISQETT